jgi:MFS family permease
MTTTTSTTDPSSSSPLNKNVKNSFIYYFTISLSESSWGYSALSAYLKDKDVGGDNLHVGLAEGMQGLAQLMFAMISGKVADSNVGRQTPIRIGGLVGFIALISIWCALFLAHGNSNVEFWACTTGLFLWGAFRGTTLAPLEALFADSVETKTRSKMLTIRYICTILGATLGPLLAAALFKSFGDEWTLTNLRRVIAIGSGLSMISLISLFRFKDKHSLSEQESGVILTNNNNNTTTTTTTSGNDNECDQQLAFSIRIRCFLADVLGSLASGMTVRFFPLFFKEETGLSPASVNAVMITTTLSMAIASYSAQSLSKKYSRIYVICTSKCIGILLLFVMATWKDMWTVRSLIIPIYVVRTVLMNCTAPLHKSILMDYTPRSSRGIWNAADSVTAFGWSGSALVGGIIADQYGYGASFIVTAAMQAVGFIALLSMIPLVKDVKVDVCADVVGTNNTTSQPLLSSTDRINDVENNNISIMDDGSTASPSPQL